MLGLVTQAPPLGTFTDKNFRSYDDVTDVVDLLEQEFDVGPDIDNTLKLSGNSAHLHFGNKTIRNHREGCIDCCRVQNVTFDNITLDPSGAHSGIKIKGASSWVTAHLHFLSHGTLCDVELGQFDNYWFPGRAPTRHIALTLSAEDGKPVTVQVWDAEFDSIASLAGQEARIRHVPKVIWFPYFLFRYTQLRCTNLYRRLTGGIEIKTS